MRFLRSKTKRGIDRGYTGKFRIQLVPSHVDYEAQKVKRRKTRAPVLLNRRTHHNTKADDARDADKDVDGFLWSFNNDDEKHSKRARKIASSYWDKFRPEVWVEFISRAGIGFRFYLGWCGSRVNACNTGTQPVDRSTLEIR